MKTGLASSPLLDHYKQKSATVAMCWKATLGNGTVLGFTAHDRDLVVDAITYVARLGFAPSTTQTQSRLAPDNTELTGILDDVSVTVADLTAGLWDFARVEVFLVNWADPSMGRDVLMAGRLGEVSIDRNSYKAELRGLVAAYNQSIGETYQPRCRAKLGDSRCKVDLDSGTPGDPSYPFTVTGTLAEVSTDGQVLTDPARTEPGPTGGLAVTGITQANPAEVTVVGHGFTRGQVVYISGVVGMVQINGQHYKVGVVTDSDTFELLGTDSTAFEAYTSGGTATPQGDAGHFDYGLITMSSGASIGLSMEVKAYAPGTITLQQEFAQGVAAGDTYTLVAGCGGRFAEDCVARFNNAVNFRGEPHLPGIDKALRVGGQQ